MPTLTYTSSNYPFQPFTKIYSADVVQCFTDISTLLNTTKLNSTNVQVHGLTRNGSSSNLAAGTANYVVYNDSNGDLTEAAQLPTTKGGLGFDATPAGAGDANKVLTVNQAGNAFQLSVVPQTPGGNVYNFYSFL